MSKRSRPETEKEWRELVWRAVPEALREKATCERVDRWAADAMRRPWMRALFERMKRAGVVANVEVVGLETLSDVARRICSGGEEGEGEEPLDVYALAMFGKIYIDETKRLTRDSLAHEMFHVARAALDPEIERWSHTPYDERTALTIGLREEILARIFAKLVWARTGYNISKHEFDAMVYDTIINTLEGEEDVDYDPRVVAKRFLTKEQYVTMLRDWLAEP